MKTRALGSSGFTVSAVGLGGMYLSIRERPSEDDAVRTIHAALDAGITLIDTADVYCRDDRNIGHNERLIARALREKSTKNVVVATKGGLERPNGAWTRNARPAHLRAACEASLKALGRDRIDLYQLHAPDSVVPLVESVGELARLQREGKIANVGLSNVSVSEIDEARAVVPIVSVQNRWNPLDRAVERDGVLARCTELKSPCSPTHPSVARPALGRSRPSVGSRSRRASVQSRRTAWCSRGCSPRATSSSPFPARAVSKASWTARGRQRSS